MSLSARTSLDEFDFESFTSERRIFPFFYKLCVSAQWVPTDPSERRKIREELNYESAGTIRIRKLLSITERQDEKLQMGEKIMKQEI